MSFWANLIRAISSSMWTLSFVAVLLVSGVHSFCPFNSQNSSSRPSCYYYFNLPKTFADATVFCQSFGAQLASITNAFEANQVWENSQAQGVGKNASFWLGANDVGQNGQYSWLDGTPFSYARWGNNQPDVSKKCLSMQQSDGKWYSADCFSTLGFTCISPLNKNFVPPCESGWTWLQSSNSCYKVIHDVKTMQDAESECQTMSAHLTSIHGEAENTFVNTISMAGINLYSEQMVYIGMTKNHNGVFEWTDGSPVDYYNWAQGEPNNEHGKELCVETYADEDRQRVKGNYEQKWNDCLCDVKMRAAVCKKPARN